MFLQQAFYSGAITLVPRRQSNTKVYISLFYFCFQGEVLSALFLYPIQTYQLNGSLSDAYVVRVCSIGKLPTNGTKDTSELITLINQVLFKGIKINQVLIFLKPLCASSYKKKDISPTPDLSCFGTTSIAKVAY